MVRYRACVCSASVRGETSLRGGRRNALAVAREGSWKELCGRVCEWEAGTEEEGGLLQDLRHSWMQ